MCGYNHEFTNSAKGKPVAQQWAILVAIDSYLHAGIVGVEYAESDAKQLSAAFNVAGIPRERQLLLLDRFATRTAIQLRVRDFLQELKRGDELFVYCKSSSATDVGAGSIDCWDTLPNHREASGFAIRDVFKLTTATKISFCTWFLECVPGLAEAELEELFGNSSNAACLVASSHGEIAQHAAATKQGLWSQLLMEAFQGQARDAANPEGFVTIHTLQSYLEAEMPRRLRKYFSSRIEQTPKLFGAQNSEHPLVNHGGLFQQTTDAPVLDPERFRRVVFRSETTTKIKELANFRKTFSLPDTASPANRKFVARIAADELRADLEDLYERARELGGLKRKDLELTAGQDGAGALRTPDFEYTISLDLDTEEPSRLIWRREVGQFTDPAFVRDGRFAALFGPAFDRLVFHLSQPIDVEAFLDRLESEPAEGLQVAATSDGRSCEVTLAGMPGTILVQRNTVTVRGRDANRAGLLDLFLAFLGKVGPMGESQAMVPTSQPRPPKKRN